jgi:hypothetical protein
MVDDCLQFYIFHVLYLSDTVKYFNKKRLFVFQQRL